MFKLSSKNRQVLNSLCELCIACFMKRDFKKEVVKFHNITCLHNKSMCQKALTFYLIPLLTFCCIESR